MAAHMVAAVVVHKAAVHRVVVHRVVVIVCKDLGHTCRAGCKSFVRKVVGIAVCRVVAVVEVVVCRVVEAPEVQE